MADVSKLDYLTMNLRELRNYCIKNKIPTINRTSDRQSCINALVKHKHDGDQNRRRSGSKSRVQQLRQHSRSRSPMKVEAKSNSKNSISIHSSSQRRARKRSRLDMTADTPDAAAANMELPSKRRRKTNTPSTMTTPEREPTPHSQSMPVRNPRISSKKKPPPPPAPAVAPPAASDAPFPTNYRSQNFMSLLDSDQDDTDEDVDVFNQHPRNNNNHNSNHNSNSSSNSSSNVLESVQDSDDDDSRSCSAASRSGADEDGEDSESDHGLQTQTHTRTHGVRPQRPTKVAPSPSHVLAAAAASHHSRVPVKRLLTQPVAAPAPLPLPPPPQPPMNEPADSTAATARWWWHRLARVCMARYTRLLRSCSAMLDMVLWLPLKLYAAFQFLQRHWLALLFAILLSVLVISPLSQLFASWTPSPSGHTMWTRLPHFLRLRSSTVYCDSDDDEMMETMTLHYDCEPCPSEAVCANGEFLFCKGDNKKLIRGECKYDPLELKQLMQQMHRKSAAILAARAGQFECQQFALYNFMYGIDASSSAAVKSRLVSAKELGMQLASLMRFDYASHFFQSAFAKFKTHVRDMALLYRDDVVFEEHDESLDGVGSVFYAPRAHKSIGCLLCVLLQTHLLAVTTSTVAVMLVLYIWYKRKRKRARRTREKQLILDRKENVIAILDEYQKHSHNKWIPVLVVQERVMGYTHESVEWRKVEKEVDRDAKVVKSSQMIDGLQKLCWKLSETALIGTN